MPRRKLTAKEKTAMQEARKVAKEQSDAALGALSSNPQFENPKMWAKVAPETISAIEKAIAKAGAAAKCAQIAKLEKELATLKGD
jgi:hypothetical protein